jgi:hypothetical protein
MFRDWVCENFFRIPFLRIIQNYSRLRYETSLGTLRTKVVDRAQPCDEYLVVIGRTEILPTKFGACYTCLRLIHWQPDNGVIYRELLKLAKTLLTSIYATETMAISYFPHRELFLDDNDIYICKFNSSYIYWYTLWNIYCLFQWSIDMVTSI